MQMTPNLPMYEELFQGAPGLGHIPRAMSPQDSTDGGIVDRIKKAAMQGMISPQAAQYLMENLLDSDDSARAALRRMPGPANMPPLENTFPYGLMRGLLNGGE